jgi:hypothetical protein
MGQVDDFFLKARGIFTDKESSAFERFKQVYLNPNPLDPRPFQRFTRVWINSFGALLGFGLWGLREGLGLLRDPSASESEALGFRV